MRRALEIFPFLIDPEQQFAGWAPKQNSMLVQVVPAESWSRVGTLLGGRIRRAVPNERIVFTFGWDEPGHPIPASSTQIEITLIADSEKTCGPPSAPRTAR